MLRPKLVLQLAEILQNPPCLRNTASIIPSRYRKSHGTIHFITQLNINDFLHALKWSNSSTWPINRTLSGATTPDRSGPGSNGNKEVLRIPPNSSITVALPLGELFYFTPVQRFSRCILRTQPTGGTRWYPGKWVRDWFKHSNKRYLHKPESVLNMGCIELSRILR